jgi:cytidine deaminase
MTLLEAAAQVRENAHAPYSNFKVGVAIRATSGRVYTGCNVENASYPEGTCAEAGAIAAMVAAGDTEIAEVVVLGGGADPLAPCGGCRQRLREFSRGDMVVTMATTQGAQTRMRMDELLPAAFGRDKLE